ncbi:zinc finger MYM-type protein 1-like [Acanthochromis polyacanthus]|uniref:zinc finger MYM-type protein 1-like n=1 Tax=Acanthochromis polyacanthus TaxID=80966 RepID=UPI0022348078|nr:zinc finger MYM-type protein 1-like [Acanthochromis polyacanthus]
MKRLSKPSGAAFRKRRREEEEKRAQSRDALRKYLQPRQGPTVEAAAEEAASSVSQLPSPVAVSDSDSEHSSQALSRSTAVIETQLQNVDAGAVSEAPSSSTVILQTPPQTVEPEGPSTSSLNTIRQPTGAPSTSTDVCEPISAAPIDPADWPPNLSDSERTELVSRGPPVIRSDFSFPKKQDGRSCHHRHFFRLLTNGEKIKRSWLMYSKKKDSLYCFCCKLFSQKTFKLSKDGTDDWKNCGDILKTHENSKEHTNNMGSWRELESRSKKGQTIDNIEMAIIHAERRRWREVLTRLVAIIKSLAERNIALRGSTDQLNQPNNGNFLKEVELMAQFDPVLKEHIIKIEGGASHTTYLGKTIQNELIDCLSERILHAIVKEINESKYYAIILDCTPDVSHVEQLSVIIRIVSVEGTPQIKEHFLGFLEAEETTGEGLSALILKKLLQLNIPFDDCRGQSYDNGANMKGKNKGVQARLLQVNPRALFVPCGAHTVNLVVSDAAKSSAEATCYFGYLQKLFNLNNNSMTWLKPTKSGFCMI